MQFFEIVMNAPACSQHPNRAVSRASPSGCNPSQSPWRPGGVSPKHPAAGPDTSPSPANPNTKKAAAGKSPRAETAARKLIAKPLERPRSSAAASEEPRPKPNPPSPPSATLPVNRNKWATCAGTSRINSPPLDNLEGKTIPLDCREEIRPCPKKPATWFREPWRCLS